MTLLFMSKAYTQNNKILLIAEKDIDSNKIESASKKINEIDFNALQERDKAFYILLKAKIEDAKNNDIPAYQNYLKAKSLYMQAGETDKAMDINIALAYLVESQKNSKNLDSQTYLDEYLEYAKKHKDPLKLAQAYAEIASKKITHEEANESLEYFQKAKALNKKIKDKELEILINNNLAALYNDFLDRPDSALYYFKKDLPYLIQKGNKYDICCNYVNQAASYYYLENYPKSIELLKIADTIPIKKYTKGVKSIINKLLSYNYLALGDYKNAYETYVKFKDFEATVNSEEQSIAISEIQTKYQTREKELENEVLKNKDKKNKALLYIFIGLLLASLIIGFLIIKNARKKEKISRQEKLIEQQKLEKALKDYELNSIDMMLEGQEKERQRIANDLHDNLGSMLATLKINFEHLKLRKNELRDEETKLYERTDELIEEAYQKVRRLAHAKNAGVFANEGLIPALKKMAEKISIPGKLQIHIVPFGFNERLENTLEIAIFRMVQELATNIIKHSKATEATVQLTHHDDNINIIIEDNGIGFDSAKITDAEGMGISTMKKKVEQLNGSFTIDSTPSKGTTIIIDIPV